MKKLTTFIIRSILATILIISGGLASAAEVATYCFSGDFQAVQSGVPALVPIDPLGRGSFEEATVLGEDREVYVFDGNAYPPSEQAGLALPAMAGVQDYTIDLIFRFDEDPGWWRRILKANPSSDNGLYTEEGRLQIWDNGALVTGTTDLGTGIFNHVVVTVSSSGAVRVYLNGALELSTVTTSLFSPTRLFIDQGGPYDDEFSDGAISLLRIYDRALSDAEVQTLWQQPFSGCDAVTPPCQVELPVIFSQDDPRWKDAAYDHISKTTIGDKGCALSCLAMALNYASIAVHPGNSSTSPQPAPQPLDLNNFLIKEGGYAESGGISWFTAVFEVSNFTGNNVEWIGQPNSWINSLIDPDAANEQLEEIVCNQGFPAIVGVNMKSKPLILQNGELIDLVYPGHFVLVTEKQDDEWKIVDPKFNKATLDDWDNSYETRGYVKGSKWNIPLSPFPQLAVLDQERTGNSSNLTDLELSVVNAILMVVDPQGNRVGIDPETGEHVGEIPQSTYFIDSIDDDNTGEEDTALANLVNIRQLLQDTYLIVATGLTLGSYNINIEAFSQDGTRHHISISGVAEEGSSSSFEIQLEPGATPQVIRITSFRGTLEDIRISYDSGLIDNRGIANALSKKIEAASKEAAKGRNKAASNILRAFKNQVNAQAGKHIKEAAVQILLEDADYLIVQLS